MLLALVAYGRATFSIVIVYEHGEKSGICPKTYM